jgi:hypothetical protein
VKVGGGINRSLKLKLSPEKVDEAPGRSVLLDVNVVDGAYTMISGLTPKK